MTLLAILLAAVVGTTLGLFGGGGAVLAVPVFVYALGVPAKSAIPMSFIVIGTASAVGAIARWTAGVIKPGRGVGFGVAAMCGAFVGGRLGVLIDTRIQLSLFAIAVIAASTSMWRSADRTETSARRISSQVAFGVFFLIGILTGLIGIGGGFLFVPALVAVLGVPMAEATGLSLMVIAMNAVAAYLGYRGHVEIDWPLVALVTAVVIVAMLVAGRIAPRIPVPSLKRGFAVVLIVIGGLVLFENLK